MNFLSVPSADHMAGAHLHEGWKDKKAGRRERTAEKRPRDYGIFRNRISKVVSVVPRDSQERGKGWTRLFSFLLLPPSRPPFFTGQHPVVSASKFFSPFPLSRRPSIFLLRLEDPSAVTADCSYCLRFRTDSSLSITGTT